MRGHRGYFADAHDDANNQSDRVSVAFLAEVDDRLEEGCYPNYPKVLTKNLQSGDVFVKAMSGKLDGINRPTEM